ncbi:MAG: hypothetical protein HZC29_05190 [Thaumarchaeota archaeon]|nr:hypothetical protein [Nitrososphaerota archaeon]
MTLRQELQQRLSKDFEKAPESFVTQEKNIELKLNREEKIYIGYDKAPRKRFVKLTRKVPYIFDFLLCRIFWGKREWIAGLQKTRVPIFYQTCDSCKAPNIVGIWQHGTTAKCRACKKEFTVHIHSTLEPINDMLRSLDIVS